MDTGLEKKSFDYIIAGAGCAGLSLLLRILQEPTLSKKEILILDNDYKQENERTWCFWETEYGFHENLVFHKWENLSFYDENKKLSLNISPYKYKMIRSVDMYRFAKSMILKRKNIIWKSESVTSIGNENGKAFAIVNGIKYSADYLFNSIQFSEDKIHFQEDDCYKILQHFNGWVIETEKPFFNPNEASFMDFRVDQSHGATFAYVLPISTTKALVEYTFFNEELLPKEEYATLLKNYLLQFWNISEYKICHTEYGVIPMTNHHFTSHEDAIINMGTAGGYTKPSSGYTFQFIQKHTAAIIKALKNNQSPIFEKSFYEKRFDLYDATLLNVLHFKKMSGRNIFSLLFSKLPTPLLFKFLDNETTLLEELKVLNTMPTAIFLKAAIQEFFKTKLKKGGHPSRHYSSLHS